MQNLRDKGGVPLKVGDHILMPSGLEVVIGIDKVNKTLSYLYLNGEPYMSPLGDTTQVEVIKKELWKPQIYWAWWDNKVQAPHFIYPRRFQVEMCSPDGFKSATKRGERRIVEVEVIERR